MSAVFGSLADVRASWNISATAEIDSTVQFGPNCGQVTIGHGSRIRGGVYIDAEILEIGDYVTINPGVVIHGESITIGHNCWFGQYSILDGHGGRLSIGNNVGVGAHSQLWSHMKFGDRLEGCRWHEMSELVIEDDVWFVGHCLVTPCVARRRSMLMLGSMATKNLEENRTYAGSPAKDVTHVFGPQFLPRSLEDKEADFVTLVKEWGREGHETSKFVVLQTPYALSDFRSDVTYFDLATRTYYPTYSRDETAFIRFLLYDRAKFVPRLRKLE